MSFKVLLVNRFKCSNLGDQEIFDRFSQFLVKNYSCEVIGCDYTSWAKNSISVKSDLPFRSEKKLLKKIISPRFFWLRNIFRVVRQIKSNDPNLIVLGGGELLMPGVFCMASFVWVFIAKIARIKVILSHVGVRGNFDYLDRQLIKYVAKNVEGFCVRDEQSLSNLLNIIGPSKNIIVVPDIVFTSPPVQRVDNLSNVLTFAVVDYGVYQLHGGRMNRNQYYDEWIKILRKKLKPSDEICLAYSTAEDFHESKSFLSYLNSSDIENRSYLANINNIEDLKLCISASREVIGARMHLLMIAYIHGVEIDCYELSDKLRVFLRDLKNNNPEHLNRICISGTRDFLDRYIF